MIEDINKIYYQMFLGKRYPDIIDNHKHNPYKKIKN
jgi:hypothetical protein